MLRKIILSLLLSFLTGTAMADAATMWIFPDGRGAMPIETEQISMEAESVSIVPTGNTGPEMSVTCVYYLRNLTDQPIDVSVGFPFESFYEYHNYFDRKYRSYDRILEMMSGKEARDIPANSMVPYWLQFSAFTDVEEYEVTYERGVVNIENRMVFWPLLACWNMHFQPGETVRLVNTYNIGWNYFEGSGGNYEASLTYIVRSGALWAGRIGDAVISITIPERYPLPRLSYGVGSWTGWSCSPQVDGNRVTWHFTDWKPVEDLTITLSGHLFIDDRGDEVYGAIGSFFIESELYSNWIADEIDPAAQGFYSYVVNYFPAERIAGFLENAVFVMEEPYSYFPMNGELSFDQEKMETVIELHQYLAEYRINIESAGFDFLLPMTALRRNWSDVNLEMYCASPRDQASYLILLENIEVTVQGRPIIDPVLGSLYRFRTSCINTLEERDTTFISREEIRDFWMNGGGCNLPLVLSSCSENSDISQIIDLSIEASSELAGQAGNNYSTDNLLDGYPETAWVEGVYGYGHGEVITVSTNDKIIAEGFTVRNGYCKPGGAWLENARIRKFFICLNDTPLMVAELEDTMDMQVIRFPVNLCLDEDDSLTFEILEIYPGSTYQDAAVSELSLFMEH